MRLGMSVLAYLPPSNPASLNSIPATWNTGFGCLLPALHPESANAPNWAPLSFPFQSRFSDFKREVGSSKSPGPYLIGKYGWTRFILQKTQRRTSGLLSVLQSPPFLGSAYF